MRLLTLTFAGIAILYVSLALQSPSPMAGETSPANKAPFSTTETDTSRVARIAMGAELFARTCQRCHNPRGPAERTDREWVIVMQHMQTRASLTRKQSKLIREFLLASNDTDLMPGRLRTDLQTLTEITDEAIDRGRLVYQGAGTCFACHGSQLEGGPIAPNLKDDRWKIGGGEFESILNVVRNGAAGTAMAAYPGGITDEQAQNVAAYVWAVSQQRTSL